MSLNNGFKLCAAAVGIVLTVTQARAQFAIIPDAAFNVDPNGECAKLVADDDDALGLAIASGRYLDVSILLADGTGVTDFHLTLAGCQDGVVAFSAPIPGSEARSIFNMLVSTRGGKAEIVLPYGATMTTEVSGDLVKRPPELTISAYRGKLGDIQQAIDGGSDVGETMPNGFTPLAWASKYNSADVVTALIENGADPSTPTRIPPIILATERGDAAIIRALIEGGADMDVSFPFGIKKPILYYAAEHGFARVVSVLLEHGADKDQTYGIRGASAVATPLLAAAQNDSTSVAGKRR